MLWPDHAVSGQSDAPGCRELNRIEKKLEGAVGLSAERDFGAEEVYLAFADIRLRRWRRLRSGSAAPMPSRCAAVRRRSTRRPVACVSARGVGQQAEGRAIGEEDVHLVGQTVGDREIVVHGGLEHRAGNVELRVRQAAVAPSGPVSVRALVTGRPRCWARAVELPMVTMVPPSSTKRRRAGSSGRR